MNKRENAPPDDGGAPLSPVPAATPVRAQHLGQPSDRRWHCRPLSWSPGSRTPERDDLIMGIKTNRGGCRCGPADCPRNPAVRQHSGRNAYCVGKMKVYSAGVTIFAAFPKPFRFLTTDGVPIERKRDRIRLIDVVKPHRRRERTWIQPSPQVYDHLRGWGVRLMLFSRPVQSADLGQPAEPACNLAPCIPRQGHRMVEGSFGPRNELPALALLRG